jgi:hypothetical protein
MVLTISIRLCDNNVIPLLSGQYTHWQIGGFCRLSRAPPYICIEHLIDSTWAVPRFANAGKAFRNPHFSVMLTQVRDSKNTSKERGSDAHDISVVGQVAIWQQDTKCNAAGHINQDLTLRFAVFDLAT